MRPANFLSNSRYAFLPASSLSSMQWIRPYPVSYTHLDVYKRQVWLSTIKVRPLFMAMGMNSVSRICVIAEILQGERLGCSLPLSRRKKSSSVLSISRKMCIRDRGVGGVGEIVTCYMLHVTLSVRAIHGGG